MKKKITNTTFFLAAFIGMLFLCEVFIYIAGISRKSEVEFSETLGKTYRPDYSYVWFSEGFSMGSVNSFGYLGAEYKVEKPENVKRIALLGDSYIEGFQVFDRNHLRRVLEEDLNAKLEDSVQVLNFGRSNFNLPNMYAYQKLMVDKFDSDLILYFLSEEDLTSSETDPLLPNINPETFEVEPFLSRTELQKFTLANTVLKKSALAYMLNSARRKLQENSWAHTLFAGKFDNEIATDKSEKEVPQITRNIFSNMDAEKVILVYREKHKISPLILDALNNSGLRFIDLSEFLLRLERNGNNPNYWPVQNIEGHWNVKGHKAVGEELSEFLK